MSIFTHLHTLPNINATFECAAFQAAAQDTWERIEFSRSRLTLKIHEPTITQNLVYELNKLIENTSPKIGISIYESIQESTNGSDLLISIRGSLGHFITFAVQSKIIYHNGSNSKTLYDGNYQKLKHHVGKGSNRRNQVDLLLSYSKTNGCIPLYLLYNFVTKWEPTRTHCDVQYDKKQYGCSIVSAQYLKDNHGDTEGNLNNDIYFRQLHPNIAMPWYVLVCCFTKFTLTDIFSELKTTLPTYKINELDQLDKDIKIWKLLGKEYPINEIKVESTTQNDIVDFNPKFMIRIDRNK